MTLMTKNGSEKAKYRNGAIFHSDISMNHEWSNPLNLLYL